MAAATFSFLITLPAAAQWSRSYCTLISRSISASTLDIVILCMTMSIMRFSSFCHFCRADLETLLALPAPAMLPKPVGLCCNFFLLLERDKTKLKWDRIQENEMSGELTNQATHMPQPQSASFYYHASIPSPTYPMTLVPSMLASLSARYPNTLFLLFHCLTSPLTLLPVSGSELLAVVLADNSAPESVSGGAWFQRATRPATRSDMGLAKRLRAVTSWVFLRNTSSC